MFTAHEFTVQVKLVNVSSALRNIKLCVELVVVDKKAKRRL